MCLRCNMDLPRTGYHLSKDNPVERLFWGRMELERATSLFFYRKGSPCRLLLHQLKYGERPGLARTMGRLMASELLPANFFQGIDLIVPVVLHPRKERKRGYNQSERIASGISQVTGLPVESSLLVRLRNTETQTRKTVNERWENVNGVFALRDSRPFVGKHVLIVDDVLTTGATITACADAFKAVEGIRISVLTLAVADS